MDLMEERQQNQHIDLIKRMKRIKKNQRGNFFECCSDQDIKIICESCKNIFDDTLGFNEKTRNKVKKKLLPIKKEFIAISRPKTSRRKRRELLKNPQVGSGVFTILASTVLPILISAITKAIKNKQSNG